MDGFQGAILSVKLKHLNEWNEARRANAQRYDEALAGIDGLSLPIEAEGRRHVYYVYAIRTAERDALMKALGERGIACNIHFPVPVHLQGAYADLGYSEGDFPKAEQCAKEVLSLPMYAELTAEQVDCVAREIRNSIGVVG